MSILSSLHRFWLTSCLGLLCVATMTAQGQPSFEAFADAKQVLLRSYVEVSFVLHNADGSDFRPPSFEGFIVVDGPSRSSSTTIINGEMSTESAYLYTLQPRRTGKLQIGAASVRVNGRVLKTKPINIEILDSKKAGATEEAESVFLRAEPDVQDAWIGQQITLDYKLFTTQQVGSFNPIAESQYQGFYAEEIRRFNAPLQREVYKSRQYYTKIIKRVALFAQQSGDFSIDPFEVQLHLLTDNSDGPGFFFNRQVKRVPASTSPIVIKAKTLPPSAPPSFNGAVGHYSAIFSFGATDLSTDDALQIKLSITGDGDPKRLQAPTLTIPDGFDAYPPKMTQERYYEDNGRIISEKTFEYLFIPLKAGTYTIEPSFSYFDTDSTKYVTLKGEPTNISVRQGTQPRRSVIVEAEQQAGNQDIHALKSGFALKSARNYLWGSPILGVLVALPLIGFGIAAALKRRKNNRDSRDPEELRRQRARSVALQRLSQARTHLQAGQSRAFYDEVVKALTAYVCTKLQIPLSAWSKDNASRQMATAGIAENLIRQFSDIMSICEMALFAGMDNAEAMQDTLAKAETVIIGIEEQQKL